MEHKLQQLATAGEQTTAKRNSLKHLTFIIIIIIIIIIILCVNQDSEPGITGFTD